MQADAAGGATTLAHSAGNTFWFSFLIFNQFNMTAIPLAHLDGLVRVGNGNHRLKEFLERNTQSNGQGLQSSEDFVKIGTHIKIPSVIRL